MKIKLHRAQIGKAEGLDTTARTNAPYAPTWGMVRSYKAGIIDKAKYTELYHDMLAEVGVDSWRELWLQGKANDGELTFLCFCRDGQFCHTVLLIDWLVEHYPEGFEKG